MRSDVYRRERDIICKDRLAVVCIYEYVREWNKFTELCKECKCCTGWLMKLTRMYLPFKWHYRFTYARLLLAARLQKPARTMIQCQCFVSRSVTLAPLLKSG